MIDAGEGMTPLAVDILPRTQSLKDRVKNFFSRQKEPVFVENIPFRLMRDDLRFLKHKYGIRVAMHRLIPHENGDVSKIERLSVQEAVRSLDIIREEMAKYPPEYIRGLGITRFRIVDDLFHKYKKEEQVGGLAFEKGYIYVATGDDENYFRQSLHHELFHHFDFRHSEYKRKIKFFGRYIDLVRDANLDSEWHALNPKGTKYIGKGYKELQDKNPNMRPTGFAKYYGLKDVLEDRATIAEMLMTNPVMLMKVAKEDAVLMEKIDKIIILFYKRTGGRMDQRYFRDLFDSNVAEGYWDKSKF